jgi:hypothetical protein
MGWDTIWAVGNIQMQIEINVRLQASRKRGTEHQRDRQKTSANFLKFAIIPLFLTVS